MVLTSAFHLGRSKKIFEAVFQNITSSNNNNNKSGRKYQIEYKADEFQLSEEDQWRESQVEQRMLAQIDQDLKDYLQPC